MNRKTGYVVILVSLIVGALLGAVLMDAAYRSRHYSVPPMPEGTTSYGILADQTKVGLVSICRTKLDSGKVLTDYTQFGEGSDGSWVCPGEVEVHQNAGTLSVERTHERPWYTPAEYSGNDYWKVTYRNP